MRLYFLLFFVIYAAHVFAQEDNCAAYNRLNSSIRDGRQSRQNLPGQYRECLTALEQRLKEINVRFDAGTWYFPLKGYSASAIGGNQGSGYIKSGYDFFDGNKHGGHPAHDIFIQDRNQDNLGDRTGKEVEVVSADEGIVVAVETNWQQGSAQRGGNYIWIYNPTSRKLFYYAHNKTVRVQLCQTVKAGEVIATVGRTGMNASKKRSPTHLHFMVLQLDNNYYPRPIDTYQLLKKGR